MKSLAALRQELDLACRRRRLHAVTLVGGEPTLHEGIGELVVEVKRRGLVCQVLTNGLTLLSEGGNLLLRNLIGAGLDKIALHVDGGQGHPDVEAVLALRPDLVLANDVTARDLQKKDVQYTRAKGFDSFAPIGPCIAAGLDYHAPAGLAVDMACGLSASGLLLAERGWRVIGLDVAESALRFAQSAARQKQLSIHFAVLDVLNTWLPEDHFDLVLNFYFLSRPLFEVYKHTLKPGGLLFFETFVWQPGIDLRPEHYLHPGELERIFSNWDILVSEEVDDPRHFNPSRRTARLIARKP